MKERRGAQGNLLSAVFDAAITSRHDIDADVLPLTGEVAQGAMMPMTLSVTIMERDKHEANSPLAA